MEPLSQHPDCQAWRVFYRFGGLARTVAALKDLGPEHERTRCTLYRWTYPKSRNGTGGLIPAPALPSILAAARLQGVVIRPEDLYPTGGPAHD